MDGSFRSRWFDAGLCRRNAKLSVLGTDEPAIPNVGGEGLTPDAAVANCVDRCK